MKIRAVICDIYKTLLQVGPPPADAEERWCELCALHLPGSTALPLTEFHAQTERIIAGEHSAARAQGILFPEIFWPEVAQQAWPELRGLKLAASIDGFLYEHSQLVRTVQLMPGAAEVLSSLRDRNVLLGLASNSQPYTLREMRNCLDPFQLCLDLFHPDLQFFSFQHGFSKPDPYVFRFLAARLAGLGICPGETFMVGDRQDNDIQPARAQGFQTWWWDRQAAGPDSGNWSDFANELQRQF